VPALVRGAQVAGHPLIGVEALHRARRQAHLQLLLHQLVGHRVVMPVDLDVVVDVFCGQPQNTSCVALRFLWPSARGTASVAGWRDL